MTKRQSAILSAIIKEYVETAEPVGSYVLTRKYKIDFSPATIRNEMGLLEEEGYIMQPHTSAGRVPTNKGYRYFVDALMKYSQLAKLEQEKLIKQMRAMQEHFDKIWKESAKMLSSMSESVAIASPEPSEAFTSGIARILKQPEFCSVEKACMIADMSENMAERIYEIELEKKEGKKIAVYIGDEHRVTKELGCSMMVTDVELPNGQRGRLAILGPTRMKYGRNFSLLSFLTKILGGSAVILLFLT